MRFAQSCRVALAVGWKESGKLLQAALEFGSFLFIQRLVLERLQQRSGGRDKDHYVRSDRHDALAQRRSGVVILPDSDSGRKCYRIIAILFIQETQLADRLSRSISRNTSFRGYEAQAFSRASVSRVVFRCTRGRTRVLKSVRAARAAASPMTHTIRFLYRGTTGEAP